MELAHEFTVNLPVEDTWALLTNLEGIAPCMPGAELQEVDGAEYRGTVKVKLGPIVAQYRGTATIVSQDTDAHVMVVEAKGRDIKGQGSASATIAATVTPQGGASHVSVLTNLSVTGKVAQFGRTVLGDVSSKLLDQFVERLEAQLEQSSSTEDSARVARGTGAAAPTPPRRIDGPPAEPVDLLATAGTERLRNVAMGGLAILIVLWLLGRRRQ